MAEREGFEPSIPEGMPHFECGAFDHSATSPNDSHYDEQHDCLLILESNPMAHPV